MATLSPPGASLRPNLVRPALLRAGLVAGLVALLLGLASSDVLAQINLSRLQELLFWALLLVVGSHALARLFRRPPIHALFGALLALAVALHGIAALAIVATLALLAGALGARLGVDARARPALATVVGLSLIAALGGWTQGLPIHQRAWLGPAVVLALILLRAQLPALFRGLADRLAAEQLNQWIGFWPMLVVGLAVLASGHPTLQFDDLAYHRSLPIQLLNYGQNQLDAHSQVWALAPWAGDVLHGWLAVLLGAEARGALNLLWWSLLWLGLAELVVAIGLQAVHGRLAIALGGSLPLGWAMLAGMHTELASAVALTALLCWVSAPRALPLGAQARVGGILAGLLLGLKLTSLAYLGAIALGALCLAPRHALRWLPWSLSSAVACGGSSYAYAAWISGNPALPLFNGVFKSSYMAPVNQADMRFRAGLDLGDGFGALFHSSRYLESWDGTLGFHWLVLALPLLLGLLLAARRTRAGSFSVAPDLQAGRYGIAAVLLGALLLFWQMQYLRYLYPALVLGGLLMSLGLLGANPTAQPKPRLRALLSAIVVLNLAAVGNVHWLLRQQLSPSALRGSAAEQRWIDDYAPELRLLELAGDVHPQSRVLLADIGYPYIATAPGRAFAVAWYDPERNAMALRCASDGSGEQWRQALLKQGFSHLITRPAERDPALQQALQGWAVLLTSNGAAELYQLPAGGEIAPVGTPPQ